MSQQPSVAVVTQARTNKDGRFTLTLAAGIYEIKIFSPGFKNKVMAGVRVKAGQETDIGRVTLDIAEFGDPGCVPREGVPRIFTKKAGDTGASLHGTVNAPKDVPTDAVRITLKPVFGNRPSRSTTPQKSGKFDLDNLEPGVYTLMASAPSCADFVMDWIEIQAGQNSSITDPLENVPCKAGETCQTIRRVQICL